MPDNINQTVRKLNIGDPGVQRFLIVLVIVMGILIVAGTMVVGVTIVNRMTGNYASRDSAISWTAPVALPGDAEVVSVSADSGHLYLHLKTAHGVSTILVLDGFTGQQLGTVLPRTLEKPR